MRSFDEIRFNRGREVASKLLVGLRSNDILPKIYPAIFKYGVAEGSFHSYMLSALLLLGDRLGYSSVCDSPIFDRIDNILLGEGSKRPDSVWFDRGTENVRILIEFERFTSVAIKLKARNLLIMANACTDDLDLLVLMYWTVVVRSFKDLHDAFDLSSKGPSGIGSYIGPASCPIMMLETNTKRVGENICIESFIAKLFIFGGENKGYVVENFNQ